MVVVVFDAPTLLTLLTRLGIAAQQAAIPQPYPLVSLVIVQHGRHPARSEDLGSIQRQLYRSVAVQAPGLQAGEAGRPYPAIGAQVQHGDIVRWRSHCLRRQVAKLAGAGGQQRQPAGGTHPQVTARIAYHRVHAIIGKRTGIAGHVAQCTHRSGSDIEVLQAGAGRQPQPILAIADDAGDREIARRSGVVDEIPGCPVKAIETTLGTDPQLSVGVFIEGLDVVIDQAAGIGRIVLEGGDTVTVITVQASLGTDPQVALAILQNPGCRLLRQTVFHPQVIEAQTERRSHGTCCQPKPGKQNSQTRRAI